MHCAPPSPIPLPSHSFHLHNEKSMCRRCQDERNIERNLGPLIRDHSIPQEGLWSCLLCPCVSLCVSVSLCSFLHLSLFVSVLRRYIPGADTLTSTISPMQSS